MSKEVNVSEMKTMCEDYSQRMLDADNASGVNIELKKEFLIMDVDKASLEKIVNAPGFDGAFALFGLEDKGGYKRQTVILVPHGSNGKAIPFDGSTDIKGIEEHMDWDPPKKDIIYPGGGSTPNIPQGVQDAFDTVGIS